MLNKIVSIRTGNARERQHSRRIIRDMIGQFLKGTPHGLIRVPFTYPYYESTNYGHTKFSVPLIPPTILMAYNKLRKEVNTR